MDVSLMAKRRSLYRGYSGVSEDQERLIASGLVAAPRLAARRRRVTALAGVAAMGIGFCVLIYIIASGGMVFA